MKNIHLIVLFCGLSLNLFAQKDNNPEIKVPKNILKWNVMGLPTGNNPIFYERVLTPKNTLWFGFNYLLNRFDDNKDKELWSLAVEYRFYRGQPAPRGFFLAPYLKYQHIDETKIIESNGITTNSQAQINTLGGGVNLGYQLIIRRFALSGFAGYGYNFIANVSDENPNFDKKDYQTDPRFGVAIGFTF